MRSNWKGKFISANLFYNFLKKKTILNTDKSSLIHYKFNQNYFFIHNGKDFIKLKIVKKIFNFHFGDFILTRKLAKHLSKKKKKK